jgi:hypothetical protein
MITAESIKKAVKIWRVSKDERLKKKANKLAKEIKAYENGGCTLPTLIKVYFEIRNM